MHWLFIGCAFFFGFMWARAVYTGWRVEARELEAGLRLGFLKGQDEFNWDYPEPKAGDALECVLGREDVGLVRAFNRGRVEGWRHARGEELAAEAAEFLKREAA